MFPGLDLEDEMFLLESSYLKYKLLTSFNKERRGRSKQDTRRTGAEKVPQQSTRPFKRPPRNPLQQSKAHPTFPLPPAVPVSANNSDCTANAPAGAAEQRSKGTSTERVRAFRERQLAQRPPKSAPKRGIERLRGFRARRGALKHGIPLPAAVPDAQSLTPDSVSAASDDMEGGQPDEPLQVEEENLRRRRPQHCGPGVDQKKREDPLIFYGATDGESADPYVTVNSLKASMHTALLNQRVSGPKNIAMRNPLSSDSQEWHSRRVSVAHWLLTAVSGSGSTSIPMSEPESVILNIKVWYENR